MATVNEKISSSHFRTAGAVSILWLGSLAGAGCAFLVQLLLARQLTAAEFGTFAATLNMVTLVSPLASFGLGALWLRIFGEEGRSEERRVGKECVSTCRSRWSP